MQLSNAIFSRCNETQNAECGQFRWCNEMKFKEHIFLKAKCVMKYKLTNLVWQTTVEMYFDAIFCI